MAESKKNKKEAQKRLFEKLMAEFVANQDQPVLDPFAIYGTALTGELGQLSNNGGYSTEISMTGEVPGGFANFPSLVQGQVNVPGLLQTMDPTRQQYDIAYQRALQRQAMGQSLPVYQTEEQAIRAARLRSLMKTLGLMP